MGLTRRGTVPIAILCSALFAVLAQVSAELTASLTGLLGIQVTLSLGFPEIEALLALVVEANLALSLAVAFTPPFLNVEFGVQLNIQLAITLGIVAALEALVALDGELAVYTYEGANLGADLGSALAGGWNDGTPATSEVTALILVEQGGAAGGLAELFGGLPFLPGLQNQGGVKLSAILGNTWSLLLSLLSDQQSKASASIAAVAHVSLMPPTVSASLQVVAQMDAAIVAAIEGFPPMPTVAATAALEVEAQISAVASLVAKIAALLNLGSVDVYTYVGPGAELGAALEGAVPGPCVAVVLGATTSAGATALGFFGA